MSEPAPRSELKNTGYEIFIGILSVLSIVNLLLLLLAHDPDIQNILLAMNGIFSAIFLADFSYRITTAPSRSGYFFRRFGWADLLASVPVAELKILRIFRLVRVGRLLNEVGVRPLVRTLVRDRAGSALLTLLLMGILVLQFGSLEMLHIEQFAPGANITTGSDALWYTIVTISTVGYGDQYPVTNPGRLMGALIIVIGVGIFGTFTGYLANIFLTPRTLADEEAPEAAGQGAPDQLEELRALVARLDVSLAAAEHRLAQDRPGEGSGASNAGAPSTSAPSSGT